MLFVHHQALKDLTVPSPCVLPSTPRFVTIRRRVRRQPPAAVSTPVSVSPGFAPIFTPGEEPPSPGLVPTPHVGDTSPQVHSICSSNIFIWIFFLASKICIITVCLLVKLFDVLEPPSKIGCFDMYCMFLINLSCMHSCSQDNPRFVKIF